MRLLRKAANARLALTEAGCDGSTLDRLLEDYGAALRAADFARRRRAEFRRRVAASLSTLKRLKATYRSIANRIISDGYRLGIPADWPVAKVPVRRTLDDQEETETPAETETSWVPIGSVPPLIGALGDLFEQQVKLQLRQYGPPQDAFVVEEESRIIDYLRTATGHPHFEEVAVLLEDVASSALDPPKDPPEEVYFTKSVKARYERLKRSPRTKSDKGLLASYLG